MFSAGRSRHICRDYGQTLTLNPRGIETWDFQANHRAAGRGMSTQPHHNLELSLRYPKPSV